jgi:enoyl-CoA hydratase
MDGSPADGFTAIEYTVADRVGRITLARPEAGNALSMRLRLDLVRALRLAESDPDVTVVVLDAQGDAFCSGYDLKEPYGSKADRAERGTWVGDPALAGWTDQFARSCLQDWMTAWDLLKPVVAIVQGYCLAGGTELMSFADIVFVADDARIGYPPMRAMSTPDVPIMPWKMTMARAKYLQLTGNSITGETAAQWGWVAKSFPAAELEERAWAEIRAISHIDAGLLAANKQQVNQAYETMGMRTHLAQAWAWHYLSGTSRPNGGAFFNHVKDDGLRAALQWMNGPFKDEGLL